MASYVANQKESVEQCWECLRRESDCDGSHPVCKQCHSAGIVCPGYNDQKPLTWLPPGKVSRFRRKKTTTPNKPKLKPSLSPSGAGSNGGTGESGARTGPKAKVGLKKATQKAQQGKAAYSDSIVVLRLNGRNDRESADTNSKGQSLAPGSRSNSASATHDDSFVSPPDTTIAEVMEDSIQRDDQQAEMGLILATPHHSPPAATRQRHLSRLFSDLKPKEWGFIEAVEFYERVFLDYMPHVLTPSILSLPVTARAMSRMEPSIRDSFVATSIGLHLANACQNHGIYDPSTKGPLGHLWISYFHYIGLAIRALNNEISLTSTHNMEKIFSGINGLLNAELSLSRSTNWRPHVQGFLSFIRLCGGFHKLANCSIETTISLLTFILKCTITNTTSPCHDQIAEVSEFDVDDIRKVYSICTYPGFPYPADLFISIVRVNRLRHQASSNRTISLPQSDISDILDDIEAFCAEEWVASWHLPDPSRLSIAVGIFKSTVTLYAIISLQPWDPGSSSRQGSLAFHLNLLLQHLDLAMVTIISTDILVWPLLVAGIAAQTSAQRSIVKRHLSVIEKEPLFLRWAAEALSLLTRFWDSGMTRWDDCFDRPYFIVG